MTDELTIHLLGGLQISRDARPLLGFISNKATALLAYLAVTGRPHRREALAGLLWGEMPDEAAANNLRQALTNLRKLAGAHLLITRETVAFDLDAPYFLDSGRFTDLVQSSRTQPARQRIGLLQQALTLYDGDFLHGFYVRDAPDFEEWVLGQRVRLRDLALDALGDLTQLLLESGECREAVTVAARLLTLDPWREEAHAWRMLALARCGQYSAALAQYQQCRDILRQEFEAEPAAATTALYERIRAASRGPRHNLPAATTGFVGRETEIAEARALLAAPQTRLLTLLGPGGVGKTRLALEVARACEPMFLNGVWFVSLAAGASATLDPFVLALAQALGCALSGPEEPQAQLLAFLRSRELLLVLDNLEDWLDTTPWLSRLLNLAPDVKILVTSRQRLDLEAERVYALLGLALANATTDPLVSDAGQLFLRRAQRVQPDFDMAGAEATAVLQICRLVEGLPLGIELAASWAGQLSCDQIAVEIARSLDFLATSRRDVSPRQRSLRAAFDWSWSRLRPDEQQVYPRLAVFRGPFAFDAAQETAEATLPLLSALVDKSLVWRRGHLYQLHEVARQFGQEKLAQAGELTATQARHARHYIQFLAQQQPILYSSDQPNALVAIEQKWENVRAAWEWLVGNQDVAGLGTATAGLYHFLAIRSRFREGVEMFGAARQALQPLAAADATTRLAYGRVMAREGRFLTFLAQNTEAKALLTESLTIARDLGERDEMAFALNHLGGAARMEGDLAMAEQQISECLALRQQTGNLAGQAVALLELGGIAFMAADYETARARCAEGLPVAEAAGDVQTTAHLLTGLSLSYRELGQFDAAMTYGRRSQAIYETLGDRYGVLQAALTLGELDRQLANFESARTLFEQAADISQEIGDRFGEADSRYRLGQVEVALGESAVALAQFRQALSLAQEIAATPLVLDALLEIGELLAETGEVERPGCILHFLLAQPQLTNLARLRVHDLLAPTGGEASANSSQTGASLAEIVAIALR